MNVHTFNRAKFFTHKGKDSMIIFFSQKYAALRLLQKHLKITGGFGLQQFRQLQSTNCARINFLGHIGKDTMCQKV